MKHTPDNQFVATLALIIAGVIGGLAALGSKVALRELPPLTVLFLRITIMVAVLVPLSRGRLTHLKEHAKSIGILGLFWVGNLILYIVGIKYTTAIASGIIYNAVPFLVLLEDFLINRARVKVAQTVGIIIGLLGSAVILMGSIGGDGGFGTLGGNVLLVLAITCYSFYLVFSKRVSLHVAPLVLTAGTAIVGWVVAGLAMLLLEGTTGLRYLWGVSANGWIAILYLGLLLGVLMYLLIQWGIKHGSPLVAASMGYIGTLVAGVSGILFLGEKVSPQLLAGGVFIVVGVYLVSIMPLLQRKL